MTFVDSAPGSAQFSFLIQLKILWKTNSNWVIQSWMSYFADRLGRSLDYGPSSVSFCCWKSFCSSWNAGLDTWRGLGWVQNLQVRVSSAPLALRANGGKFCVLPDVPAALCSASARCLQIVSHLQGQQVRVHAAGGLSGRRDLESAQRQVGGASHGLPVPYCAQSWSSWPNTFFFLSAGGASTSPPPNSVPVAWRRLSSTCIA